MIKKNLIYHLYPLPGFEWHVEQLKRRWKLFTGKKFIALVEDEKTAPVESIIRELRGATFLFFRNDPKRGETVTFPTLLEYAAQLDRNSATLYCHGKGVSRQTGKQAEAVRLWTTLLYHHNLDFPQRLEKYLERFPVAGCFRRFGRFDGFPKGAGLWHFSGTFYWFRNKDLFERDWRKIVVDNRYGVEAYLSYHFEEKEAGCMFADRIMNPYNFHVLKKLQKQAVK